MSEYEFHEFRAIDRRLTVTEMATLRTCSTRARITPSSFVNEYSYGSFRGDEDRWMARYFDAHLYLANWGTHALTLRLPGAVLDTKLARMYCPGGSARVRKAAGRTIISLVADSEDSDGWVEGAGQLNALIGIRKDLMRGDLRGLYLAWLLCVQNQELDEAAVEPPVPRGLESPNAALRALAEFLRIDADLMGAAGSGPASLGGRQKHAAAARRRTIADLRRAAAIPDDRHAVTPRVKRVRRVKRVKRVKRVRRESNR